MPRITKTVRIRQRTEYRAKLAGTERARKGKWTDPFPSVHGTLPEKMVYAELSRRGIPFLFLNDVRLKFPEIDIIKEFQADFVLPQLKMIIEVQGAYWHSKPKTVESDAIKMAYYQLAGYKVLVWWDYDIMTRLHELFEEVPQFRIGKKLPTHGNRSYELPVVRRTKVNTSKGIITLNRKRGRAGAYKRPTARVKVKRR